MFIQKTKGGGKMEITVKNSPINIEEYIKAIKENKRTPSASGKAPTDVLQEDKVVLSPKAKELLEAKKLLSSVADIRKEKVALIKQQLENGTYQIDGEKIAVRMIKESLLDELI